jgi:hypothetical protein
MSHLDRATRVQEIADIIRDHPPFMNKLCMAWIFGESQINGTTYGYRIIG